jgi:hypothetical protein
MNVTLSIDDELVKTVRKIAVDHETTLAAMIREYLERVAAEDSIYGRKRSELDALERSFEVCQFRVGAHTWRREDLYERC